MIEITPKPEESIYVHRIINGSRVTLSKGVCEILNVKVGDYIQFIPTQSASFVLKKNPVQCDEDIEAEADNSTFIQKVISGSRVTLIDEMREILNVKVGDYVQFVPTQDRTAVILKKNPIITSV